MAANLSSDMAAPLLSLVIPVRGKANELWFTLQGLMHAGFDEQVEILVVDNEPSADVRDVCEYFSRPCLRYVEAGAIKGVNYPRSVGAAQARGEWLMVLDSHVLMQPGSWAQIRHRMESGDYPPRALIHFGVSFGAPVVWGAYRLTFDTNFWGTWHHLVPADVQQPYPIAATGNWAFLTRLTDWNVCGGFNDQFRGYGGDEIYLQLKYWRAGGQVLLDPLVRGSHWSGPRAYTSTPLELIVNTAIAGRVVVGEDFMERYGSSLSSYYQERGVAADVVSFSLSSGVSKAERSSEIALPAEWPLNFDDVLALWTQSGVQQ